MVEIVNIVGSGDFKTEFDLEAVTEHAHLESYIGITSIEHSRRQGNRINIRFEDGALGILAPSGVHIITGAKTYESLHRDLDILLHALSDSGVIPKAESDDFTVQNVICVGEMEHSTIDLNELTMILGFEEVEYEPEQFPGLVYRPKGTSCVLLIFSSGKVVITGAKDENQAESAFDELRTVLLANS